MRFLGFWLTLAAISMGIVVGSYGQVTFERLVPGTIPMDAARDSDDNFYIMTLFGSISGISKMNSLGHQQGYVLTKDFDLTSYSNRLYDFCITTAGIAAIGLENRETLMFFTCDADLKNRQLKNSLLPHDVYSARIAALADNGYAVIADYGDRDIKLLRLDANGNVLWVKIFDEAQALTPVEIYEASNNDLILIANHANDGLIIRTTSDGTVKTKKLLSVANHLAVIDTQFINDRLYAMGATSSSTTELFQITETDQIVERDVLFTSTYVYYESQFVVSDNGRVAVITRTGATRGFELMLFNASLVREQTIGFERGDNWDSFTEPKSIVQAADGYFITARTTVSIAIKTDFEGKSGTPPPFEPLDDVGLPYHYSYSHYTSVDLDNDGKKELIIANKGVSIYSFDAASGKFISKPSTVFPGDLTDIRSFSPCDFNNDGFIDLYASRYQDGSYGGYNAKKNILFKNNGDGTFRAITDSNINDPGSSTMQSAWIDINKDGYHDLFTVNIQQDRAYLNNGDGTFREMSTTNFEVKTDWAFATHYAFTDINNDGYVDYIASQNHQIDVMLNIKGERFEKHALLEFFDFGGQWNMPIVIQDFANGYVNGKKVAMLMDRLGSWFEHEGEIFYQTDAPSGLATNNEPTRGEFIDFENDGDLDVYVGGTGGAHIFNRNDDDQGFTYYRNFARQRIDDFVFTDVDQNGSPDLVGGAMLFRNTTANNWLAIRLQGNRSPSMGDGAIVSVKANGKWMHRETSTQGGHNGVVGFEPSFGLNTAAYADSVIVKWPSGCTVIRTHVEANRTITIEEGCTGIAPVVRVPASACAETATVLTVTTPGTKFQWFTSLTSPSIAETGREVTLDTLTRSITLFVANADSTISSRRQAVTINVVSPAAFSIGEEQVGDILHLSVNTDDVIDSFKWFVNGMAAGEGPTYSYPVTMINEALSICGEATTTGCVSKECIETIVTSVEDLTRGYGAFPNPFTGTLRLVHSGTEDTTFEVFTMRGEFVLAVESQGGNSVDVDLREYPAGVYFVRMDGDVFLKVVKVGN